VIELKETAEPPATRGNIVAFTNHRIPRLQHLSDDQMTRLLWLLNQTELLEKLLRHDIPKLTHGCPVAKAILHD
jgi:hypothetical protein